MSHREAQNVQQTPLMNRRSYRGKQAIKEIKVVDNPDLIHYFMSMKTRAKAAIPDDAVLLIPDPDFGSIPAYGVMPGYYNPAQMLALIDLHKDDSDAIQFIADMLETGNPEDDEFAVTLRLNQHNPEQLARIIQSCKQP